MCAIIGALIKQPTTEDFSTLRKVFHESRIRGLHATGMSVLIDGKIKTIIETSSADSYSALDSLETLVNVDGTLYLIGHCRYSTSDIQYNQPLYHTTKSIVHNGVITQEDPSRWESIYGYACETKNDSELVLHSPDPLREYPDASMAVCELHTDHIRFYRNGKRPLHLSSFSNGCIITSTRDIAVRSNLTNTGILDMSTYYKLDANGHVHLEKIHTTKQDFQNVIH